MDETQNPNTGEDTTEQASKELQINLPGKNLPTPLRLITFFTLIVGLSVIGTMFDGIANPSGENPFFYFLKISVGFLAVTAAYGIIERKRWAIWSYGLIVLIALFSSPFFALIPGAVTVYLYTRRKLFAPSIFDHLLEKFILWIQSRLRRSNPPAPF